MKLNLDQTFNEGVEHIKYKKDYNTNYSNYTGSTHNATQQHFSYTEWGGRDSVDGTDYDAFSGMDEGEAADRLFNEGVEDDGDEVSDLTLINPNYVYKHKRDTIVGDMVEAYDYYTSRNIIGIVLRLDAVGPGVTYFQIKPLDDKEEDFQSDVITRNYEVDVEATEKLHKKKDKYQEYKERQTDIGDNWMMDI